MIGLVRATVICATLALGLTAAGAADKAFKRDELADSAVKLEAQIKSEAGPVAKSSAMLRTDARGYPRLVTTPSIERSVSVLGVLLVCQSQPTPERK